MLQLFQRHLAQRLCLPSIKSLRFPTCSLSGPDQLFPLFRLLFLVYLFVKTGDIDTTLMSLDSIVDRNFDPRNVSSYERYKFSGQAIAAHSRDKDRMT